MNFLRLFGRAHWLFCWSFDRFLPSFFDRRFFLDAGCFLDWHRALFGLSNNRVDDSLLASNAKFLPFHVYYITSFLTKIIRQRTSGFRILMDSVKVPKRVSVSYPQNLVKAVIMSS